MPTIRTLLGLLLIGAIAAPLWAQPSSRYADEFKPKKPAATKVKVGLDSFMEAVSDRDAVGLASQLHPDLRKTVDEPILQFLLDEVHQSLGKPRDDERQESTEVKKVDGQLVYTLKAKIPFAKGPAEIHLSHRGNQITSFEIQSAKLEKLNQKLGARLVSDAKFAQATSEHYTTRAKLIVDKILSGAYQEAHEMLHPEIQQQFPLKKANEIFGAIQAEYGSLKDINYTGMTVNTDEEGDLKNVTFNFDTNCQKQDAKAMVDVQFVGLSGAFTGVNFANKDSDSPPAPKEITKKLASNTYRHSKENLSEKHRAKFVPLQFDYPAGWKFEKSAGTDESPNSVKIFRNIDLGDDQSYTQENFAIGSCQVSGDGDLVKLQLAFLSEQFRGQIEKGFPEFALRREGEMKFGKYDGFGFEFSSKIPHPVKDKVDCWGRVILLAPSAIGQEHGLSIVMLATSEAPELKSLDDLGVKGELPILIQSFRVGENASKKTKDDDDSAPPPPLPVTPPPSIAPPAP